MTTQLLSLLSIISLLLLLLLLLLVVPSSSIDIQSNFLLTNQKLFQKERLFYKNYIFVLQEDCNLVLYNGGKGFQSDTVHIGTTCLATLNDRGQLLVKNRFNITRWETPGGSKTGEYAAVLGPDGNVNIYGPSIWSTTLPPSSSAANAIEENKLNSMPSVPNLLFSNEHLNGTSKLESLDYTFEVTDDCNVELRQAGQAQPLWESKTKGSGTNCLLQLNNGGRLVLRDQNYMIVWETEAEEWETGKYVLILQLNRQAAVYGPIVWSSASASKS